MIELPILQGHPVRCGPVRGSRRGVVRAGVLIAVHVAILAHVAHWKIAGTTISPVEPSEAATTIELGWLNAGFVLFAALLLATLVLGRFFCGWACHVVAYQDLCAWLLGKAGLRPRPVRSRMLALVPLWAAFEMFARPTLERWLRGERHPGWQGLALTTGDLWERFPGPAVTVLTLAVDGFLLVWWLGAKGFCTYGCPYGALFGIADRFAPGRIRVNDACEGCGHCTAVCTSNVRVHEEVRLHGAVVDPGCMKCMDCVSACPKEALSFGFGAPAVSARRPPARPRRTWDFSWPEEIALASLFAAALLSFRGLYGQVPFLLAIGLALMLAFALVGAARCLRARDFQWQRAVLRRDGRITPRGAAALAGAALLAALTVHSGWIQVHAARGEALLREAQRSQGDARVAARDASLGHLLAAERAGLFGDPRLQMQLASVRFDRGETDAAVAHLRNAAALDGRALEARVRLATILLARGDRAGARRLLEEAVEIAPGDAALRARLEALRD